jgi:intracellular sulfur oxidation DsrE/DsrF family protein
VTEPDPTRFTALLRSITNLRADFGPDPAIEFGVHGSAVALLHVTSPVAAAIAALPDIEPKACSNSMRSLGIIGQDLAAGTTIVASGVGWLTRRQHQGRAYLCL